MSSAILFNLQQGILIQQIKNEQEHAVNWARSFAERVIKASSKWMEGQSKQTLHNFQNRQTRVAR